MTATPAILLEKTPRQALAALEEGMGLSEEALAQALGTSRRTLHHWMFDGEQRHATSRAETETGKVGGYYTLSAAGAPVTELRPKMARKAGRDIAPPLPPGQ